MSAPEGPELRERRELLCDICNREHPTWSAASILWNRVVRWDGADQWSFLCPTCFIVLAAERGVDAHFELRTDDGACEAPLRNRICELEEQLRAALSGERTPEPVSQDVLQQYADAAIKARTCPLCISELKALFELVESGLGDRAPAPTAAAPQPEPRFCGAVSRYFPEKGSCDCEKGHTGLHQNVASEFTWNERGTPLIGQLSGAVAAPCLPSSEAGPCAHPNHDHTTDTHRPPVAADPQLRERLTMLRCDRCGWECEGGTLVSHVDTGKYRQGSVHVCPHIHGPGYGFMRVVEAASGTPTEADDGEV